MKRAFFITILVVLMTSVSSYSCEQMKDILVYQDKEYYVGEEFLLNYLQRKGIKQPDDLRRVLSPGDTVNLSLLNTGCYRGYVATLEIDPAGKLWLTEMITPFAEVIGKYPKDDNPESIIREYFQGEDRILLDDYNGIFLSTNYKDYEISGYHIFEVIDGVFTRILPVEKDEMQSFKMVQLSRFKERDKDTYNSLIETGSKDYPGNFNDMVRMNVLQFIPRIFD